MSSFGHQGKGRRKERWRSNLGGQHPCSSLQPPGQQSVALETASRPGPNPDPKEGPSGFWDFPNNPKGERGCIRSGSTGWFYTVQAVLVLTGTSASDQQFSKWGPGNLGRLPSFCPAFHSVTCDICTGDTKTMEDQMAACETLPAKGAPSTAVSTSFFLVVVLKRQFF